MSPAAAQDVVIDRLALDIPGLDAAAAREVGLHVALGLARAGAAGVHAAAPVTIDARPGEPPERLAARIVQSVLQRIG
ncbi:MAG TPA: hypothetical protein VGM25_10230 [Caulobacteraceae bacterium]|jgi:hypothetical protein